jgi:hypothetical protein
VKEKYLVLATISQNGNVLESVPFGVFTTKEAADKFVLAMDGKGARILKELKRQKTGNEWGIALSVQVVCSKTLRDAVSTLRSKVGLPA